MTNDPGTPGSDERRSRLTDDRSAPVDAAPVDGAGSGAGAGKAIVWVSWAGTAAYLVLAGLALVAESVFGVALAILCGLLFVAGLVAFFAAYLLALGRSRTDAIGMGGLYFLLGTAPARVRRHLMGSFAAEIIGATVTASVGIARSAEGSDNLLAFGFLTPLFGIGLAGLWGARHGTFASRAVRSRPPARGSAPPPPPG